MSAAQLGERGRVYVLFAIVVLACALGSLTQTVMNSMLTGIGSDFGVNAAVGQWLTTAYMLVIGITVPAVTYLSQKFSMRNLVLLSLGFFLAGAICALAAPTFVVLLLGRILQAVATGITLPVLQSIAMTRFPPGKNGTAMGVAGIAMGFAPNIGPLIGGVLVDSLGWRSFYVMLGVAIAVLIVFTLAFVAREDAGAPDASLDVASLLLSTLGFGGLLLAFSDASSMALGNPLVWAPALVGGLSLVLFVRRQSRVQKPLINMHIFDSARYRASFVAQCLLFACFMGITLIVPLYVEGLCGRTAFEAGLVFVPPTILAAVINPLAGVLTDKVGARPVIVCAGVLLTAGSVSMVFVGASTPLWMLILMQTVRGMGVSALVGPLASWGMSDLPRNITLDGSAFATTARQACASLGTAAMVLAITAVGGLAEAGMVSAALGYQLAFGVSAAAALGMLVCVAWKAR